MKNYLGRMIILVDDYERAASFYERNFGFKKLVDYSANGQRFLHVGTDAPEAMGIWFLKADHIEESKKIGNQTAGQPAMVIYTDELIGLYQQLRSNEVTIKVEPVLTPEYKYFHCLDLYGNEIVVVELK